MTGFNQYFNYNKQYYENNKFGETPRLKEGYISSETPLGGFGDALYSTPARKSTKYNPKIGNRSTTIPGNYIYEDPKIGFQRQQQAYQQQLKATADATAAANTKQLKILQRERSAVSKLTRDYTTMLKKEADAKAKAQEEARVSAATSAANQARQGQTSNLQIQPASSTPQTAGTGAFRIRKRRSTKQQQLASSLNIGQSNTLNI